VILAVRHRHQIGAVDRDHRHRHPDEAEARLVQTGWAASLRRQIGLSVIVFLSRSLWCPLHFLIELERNVVDVLGLVAALAAT
jgi:hypothetical protein